MNVMCVVQLQNCMTLQDMQGSCSQTCPASCDAIQITRIKVEDVSDTEAEEDPMPEHVVSCMSVCHC
jgi:hypothetical protein